MKIKLWEKPSLKKPTEPEFGKCSKSWKLEAGLPLSLVLSPLFFLPLSFFFFGCGQFLKSLLNSLLFSSYVLIFFSRAAWVSFPTSGRTHTPCIGRRSLNHWTAWEVPSTFYYVACCYYKKHKRQHSRVVNVWNCEPEVLDSYPDPAPY